MKNLEIMGVQEMNAMEMNQVDGGLPLLLCVGLFAVGAGIGFYGRSRLWW